MPIGTLSSLLRAASPHGQAPWAAREGNDEMGQYVFGVLMGVLSLVGLFLASRAHDQMLYIAGLLIFALGIGFIFWLIARNTGHAPERHDH